MNNKDKIVELLVRASDQAAELAYTFTILAEHECENKSIFYVHAFVSEYNKFMRLSDKYRQQAKTEKLTSRLSSEAIKAKRSQTVAE